MREIKDGELTAGFENTEIGHELIRTGAQEIWRGGSGDNVDKKQRYGLGVGSREGNRGKIFQMGHIYKLKIKKGIT